MLNGTARTVVERGVLSGRHAKGRCRRHGRCASTCACVGAAMSLCARLHGLQMRAERRGSFPPTKKEDAGNLTANSHIAMA